MKTWLKVRCQFGKKWKLLWSEIGKAVINHTIDTTANLRKSTMGNWHSTSNLSELNISILFLLNHTTCNTLNLGISCYKTSMYRQSNQNPICYTLDFDFP